MNRLGLLLSPVQRVLFLSLYYWRDVVAREYVLHNTLNLYYYHHYYHYHHYHYHYHKAYNSYHIILYSSSPIPRNDESVQYILPLLNLITVVQIMPTTLAALQAILEPMSHIVRERLDRLFAIVKECLQGDGQNTTMYV